MKTVFSTRDKEKVLCHSERQRRISFYKAFNIGQVCPTDRTKKSAFTLAEVFSTNFAGQRKCAFTLAEVLITLGIIGIVAAMTLPTLINDYKKHVVVNKLKKFYSVMNQAILTEEAENGSLEYWLPACSTGTIRAACFENWYNEHLDKHIKSVLKRKSGSTNYEVAFADGSGFNAYATANYVHFFYCTDFKYCGPEKFDGQKTFLFSICKVNSKYKFVTSACNYQSLSRDVLMDKCLKGNSDNADVYSQGRRHSCARLIEYDGWEIKKDYPWFQAKQPEE